MSELAGFIGWVLHNFHDWLIPGGRVSRRRALLIVLLAGVVAAGLFYLAWPDGFPS